MINDSNSTRPGPPKTAGSGVTEQRGLAGPACWLVLAGDAEVTVAMDISSVMPLTGGRYGAWLRLVPVAVAPRGDLPLARWCEEELVVFDVAGRRIGSEPSEWRAQRMTKLEIQWREKLLREGSRYLRDRPGA